MVIRRQHESEVDGIPSAENTSAAILDGMSSLASITTINTTIRDGQHQLQEILGINTVDGEQSATMKR